MSPHMTAFPQLHNSHVLTHGTTAPLPCASRQQPTTPHVSHMPSQANSHADTSHMGSCTWDPQASLPFFFSQRCFQVPGEGAAALLRPTRGSLFQGEPWPANPPPILTFSCRRLGCGGLRGRQGRGDSQAVLSRDGGAQTAESLPPAWHWE